MLSSLRLATTCLVALLAAVAILPATAAGHARLAAVEQDRGAHAVLLRFDEPVTVARPHARLRDARRRRLLVTAIGHAGWSRLIKVRLPRLAPGRWTLALAVLSEDGHLSDVAVSIVVARDAAPMSALATIRAARSPPAVALARAGARAVLDGALTLAAGLAFALFAIWLPAVLLAAGGGDAWRAAAAHGLRRWLACVRVACAVAAVAAPSTVALDAAGTNVDTLSTSHAGLAALGLAVAALALRAAAGGLAAGRRAPVLEPAVLGSGGLALALPAPRQRIAVLVPAAVLLVLAPLGGHAAEHGATAALVLPAVGHVAAVSAWLGGLAGLLIACGAAKRLPEGDRGVLLAAAGTRVGRIASLSAAGVVATGVAQATLHLHAPADVLTTAWGRLVLAKAFVLALMLGWAARNRRALERDPSSVARGVGSELALAAAAVLAAAALAGAAPPI